MYVLLPRHAFAGARAGCGEIGLRLASFDCFVLVPNYGYIYIYCLLGYPFRARLKGARNNLGFEAGKAVPSIITEVYTSPSLTRATIYTKRHTSPISVKDSRSQQPSWLSSFCQGGARKLASGASKFEWAWLSCVQKETGLL